MEINTLEFCIRSLKETTYANVVSFKTITSSAISEGITNLKACGKRILKKVLFSLKPRERAASRCPL